MNGIGGKERGSGGMPKRIRRDENKRGRRDTIEIHGERVRERAKEPVMIR